MKRLFALWLNLVVSASVLALALLGCSKTEPEKSASAPAVAPTPAPAPKPAPVSAPAPKPAPVMPEVVTPPVKAPMAPTTPPVKSPEPAPSAAEAAETAKTVAKIEQDYAAATEMGSKLEIMYRASDLPAREGVQTVGYLFQRETDPELKTELLYVLQDFDGEADNILTILTMAVQANQPQEVREAGIDGMSDLEDPRAIGILQGLLNDPNEDIRDAAKDTIEILQTVTATH